MVIKITREYGKPNVVRENEKVIFYITTISPTPHLNPEILWSKRFDPSAAQSMLPLTKNSRGLASGSLPFPNFKYKNKHSKAPLANTACFGNAAFTVRPHILNQPPAQLCQNNETRFQSNFGSQTQLNDGNATANRFSFGRRV